MSFSRQVLATSMLALGPLCLAHAQSGTLDEVVVTATRSERPVSETLADVSTIGPEEIARAGASSLPELLRSLGGVEIAATGGQAGVAGLFVRGTKTSQTVVLIDGIRLENPTSGYGAIESLPLAAIERIEIVRGPTSSLYGSGAIGGVIQIFTRQGSGTPRPYVSMSVGSRGTAQVQAGVSGSSGATRFSLGASLDRTDGYEVTAPRYSGYQADRDGFGRRSLTASLTHGFARHWDAGASLLVSDGHTRYDDAFSSPDDARLNFRTSAVSVFVRGKAAENWQTELRLGDSRIDSEYHAFAYRPRTGVTTLSWQNTLTLPVGQLLLGLEQLRQHIDGEGLTTGDFAYLRDSRRTDSVYAGYELAQDRHRLRLQLRHDRIQTAGSEPSGTIAYGYQLTPQWLLRASVATAFRAPTFDDLYSPFGANPNLSPERSRGAEMAAEYRSGSALFKATAFASRIRHAIELDSNYIPQNIDSARVDGLSLEARHRLGDWTLRGAATFQNPRGEQFDAAGGRGSGPLVRRAKRFASIGVDWQPSALRLGAELVTQGRRIDSNAEAIAGYGVMSLSAGYRLSPDLELFARVDNLGDRNYETAWGYPMPPRTVMVGFAWQPKGR